MEAAAIVSTIYYSKVKVVMSWEKYVRTKDTELCGYTVFVLLTYKCRKLLLIVITGTKSPILHQSNKKSVVCHIGLF